MRVTKTFLMRALYFLLLLLPLVAGAQNKKSAHDLANENVMQYLSDKIFRSKAFRPLTAGEVEAFKMAGTGIRWKMTYNLSSDENPAAEARDSTRGQLYNFTFYLDRQMQVVLAESVHRREGVKQDGAHD